MNQQRSYLAITRAGLLLGFGLGGFADGIVLHQILQWHHLISNVQDVSTSRGIYLNVLADGLFHATMWLVTVAAIVLLWRARARTASRPPGRILFGNVLIGWGLFHAVDELLNHRLFGLHHIRPGPNELLWDLGYFGLGLLLILIGGYLIRGAAADEE